MSERGTCKDCRWLAPDAAVYECRAAPPSLVVLTSEDGAEARTFWPEVKEDDWCGRFTPHIRSCSNCELFETSETDSDRCRAAIPPLPVAAGSLCARWTCRLRLPVLQDPSLEAPP